MTTGNLPTIGFIGLGQMGAPMVRNLIKAGYRPVIHNRSRAIVETIAAEGADPASSPREVAERVEILFSCVGFPADVERVYLGEGGAIEGARAGQVFCDLSTVGPDSHKKIAAQLAEQGVGYLDAPISGGTTGAEAGTLTIMVGGEKEHFDRVRPMLDVMGQNIHLVGPTGAGATIKLINQMLNYVNVCGAIEGLILATKAGIEPGLAHEILRTSSGTSRSLDAVAATAFSRNFEPGFQADLMHKDVSLAVALGRDLGVRLLAGSLAEQIIQEALSAGYGKKTFTAPLLVQEQLAGLEVTRRQPGRQTGES
jgi:3-hydroxyisobutyrate dehydrogenase-like beta-hydroxyacid dehydrogenase